MDTPIDDETFEDWIFEAIEELPETFQSQLGSVAILIEDEPDPEDLARHNTPQLFGLYVGVPRSRLSADGVPIPSKLTIYKGTFERTYRTRDGMRKAVHEVVRHEIAHHLGISDERLEELAREHGNR
ncbi:MAG: metallopeptidase family protein [Chloroflexota bacterium]